MSVTLHPNGQYWSARWRDTAGRQRNKCLGRMDKVSERSAQALCRRIEADIMYGKAGAATAITLEAYCKQYIDSHPEYSPKTRYLHELSHRYLIAHFGAKRKIGSIEKPMARAFRTALAKGEVELKDENGEVVSRGTMAESTVCRTIRDAKQLFGQAASDDQIVYNPFAHLVSSAPAPDKTWAIVTLEHLDKLLAVAPNNGWKCFLGLCRLAGLRVSEAAALRWSNVDLNYKDSMGNLSPRLTVLNPGNYKTTKKRTRVAPICPQLAEILNETFMDGQGADLVISGVNVGGCRPKFKRLCKLAGIEPWIRPYHTMRKNLQEEWSSILPEWAVDEFTGEDGGKADGDLKESSKALGNSPEVARRHYVRPGDALFAVITANVTKNVPNQQPENRKLMPQ